MTARILKSRVTGIPDFAAAVAEYAKERSIWRRHMANVGKDPVNFAAYPAPQPPHPDIIGAVRAVDGDDGVERYEPDFELLDDSPTSDDALRQAKDALLFVVSRLEDKAMSELLPVGKRRLYQMRADDIRHGDAKRHVKFIEDESARQAEILEKLPAKKRSDPIEARRAIGPLVSIDELVEKSRDASDHEFLAGHVEREEKAKAIQRHAAQLQHDIEDLTEETIGAWMPAPFPT